MNYQRLVDTAVFAGEIMLRSGAETYRVEETINYILNTSEVKRTEAFVMLTGITASVSGPDLETITVVRRVTDHKNDLRKVAEVNEISRRLCGGELELETAYEELEEIDQRQEDQKFYYLCFVGVPAGFALLFGGGTGEILVSGVNGVLLALIALAGAFIGTNAFFQDVISAAVITVVAVLGERYLPFAINTETVIISSIMPLVPGVAITNAIRDTLRKDYISGGARALEAFMKAAAVALGAALGLAVTGGAGL